MAKRRIAYGRCFGALVLLTLLVLLVIGGAKAWHIYRIYHGGEPENHPDPEKFPVNGVDVSCYQGNVDWQVIASQNITFAFIKATEGSSFHDPNFAENWNNAAVTELYTGAYHFFSFESEGVTQAQNFIDAVGELGENHLPPVVDLELYGDYIEHPPEKEEVRRLLDDMLDTLEEYYGVKPILYTPEKTYYMYLMGGDYAGYPMWIANTRMEPIPRWTFWQYTDDGKLEGYDGMKNHDTRGTIDLNVYNGSLDEFLRKFGFTREELS